MPIEAWFPSSRNPSITAVRICGDRISTYIDSLRSALIAIAHGLAHIRDPPRRTANRRTTRSDPPRRASIAFPEGIASRPPSASRADGERGRPPRRGRARQRSGAIAEADRPRRARPRRGRKREDKMRKAPRRKRLEASQGINPGGVLLSHTATRAVPSAPKSLTSEFGMGSGVASSKSPPETCGFQHPESLSRRGLNPRCAWRGRRILASQAESCS